jgi:hypothetical protein
MNKSDKVTNANLPACPVCGCTVIKNILLFPDKFMHMKECANCHAVSPAAKTEDEGIDSWVNFVNTQLPTWIPVTSFLPYPFARVIVRLATDSHVRYSLAYYDGDLDKWIVIGDELQNSTITHWINAAPTTNG